MTPYIFRKYPGYNPSEIKCWSLSTVIDTNSFDVEDITFSRGASKAGTSIPSPFARMELFDTAFHIVSTDKKNNLRGKTIYHQLVSDCLDVMQLLFNSKNSEIGVGKKIWFKEWKVKENIAKLKLNGGTHPHYLLAKSFEQIFTDSINPRFVGTDSIFLIYCEGRLLGGTSPLTLFFTSPNWSRYILDGIVKNENKSTDGDIFFDDDYRALYERDSAFIEYLYKLLLLNKEGFKKCVGLRKYINRTIELERPDLVEKFKTYKPEIALSDDTDDETGSDNVNANSLNIIDKEYERLLTDVNNPNSILRINGIFYYHQIEAKEKSKIQNVSDFIIRTNVTKYKTQYNEKRELQTIDPPLVLVDKMNVAGDYLEKGIPWDPNTKIKGQYFDLVPLYDRKLPLGNSQSIKYPFLTTDDFLEDLLVEMRFSLNGEKFYTGFKGEFKYLLPIKKEYFNFFSLADLKENLSISVSEGLVKVDLKVPIRNRKGVSDIIFTKLYSKGKGNIVECVAGIGIYPFYQINDVDANLQCLNEYTILLAERNERIKLDSLKFLSFKDFASEENSIDNEVIERSTSADVTSFDSLATSKYYKIKQAFDYLELNYNNPDQTRLKGLIIPNFELRTFNKDNLIRAYTFAIDFGTSNTHVAYMENSEALPRPFEINELDQQMVLLNAPGDSKDLGIKYGFYGGFPAIGPTLSREFLPSLITSQSNSTVSFPFKTASCEIAAFNNTEKSKIDLLFSHINIGYLIDQEEKKSDGTIAGNIIYTTNLKWLLENNNDDSNQARVKFFLKQLLSQIKSKTIINRGKPSELKIVWSVPLSMDRGNKSALKGLLTKAFDEVFQSSGAKLLDPIPESVAPYFFLTKSEAGIQDTANTINVDIGGGTTDVMMFMESSGIRDDKYLTTSFRFAGSDIWGSGYDNKLKDNGFIKNYLVYKKNNNINPDEIKYFNKVRDDNNLSSDDLISLLFRFDQKFKFSDSITIGNPNLSLILYLHFSAIIYHISQIVDLKKYPLPRYLSFTGKGSQYIKLICGGDEVELEAFTKLLFKAYSNQKVQSSFKVHLNPHPKEITANGAVLYALADAGEKNKYNGDFEFIHPGFNPKNDLNFAERISKIEENEPILISESLLIDSPLNIAVLNNLNNFLDITLTDRDIINFLRAFKITNIKEALMELKWDNDIYNGAGYIYDSYKRVLQKLHKQDKDNQLPESLFFFALKDALYRLSKSIAENKQFLK